MSEVPTLQHEVERKAVEALEMIAGDLELGKITEAQYSYALTALWASCAGIAGSDFMLMMELAKQEKRGASFFTREYYLGEKGHIAKISNTHQGIVVLDLALYDGTHKSRKVFDLREHPSMYVAAKAKFQELGDNLISKGFNQI